MVVARSAGSCSNWPFTLAAHALINPRARMNARGKRKPLMGKFSTARCVWAPYNASLGTRTSPMVSRSRRYITLPYGRGSETRESEARGSGKREAGKRESGTRESGGRGSGRRGGGRRRSGRGGGGG